MPKVNMSLRCLRAFYHGGAGEKVRATEKPQFTFLYKAESLMNREVVTTYEE